LAPCSTIARRLIIVVTLCTCTLPLLQARDVTALADSIMQFPPHQQVNELWKAAFPTRVDTQFYISWYTALEDEFRLRDEALLEREAWMMLVSYRSSYIHMYKQYGIHLLEQYAAEARDRGWKVQEAECLVRKGLGYYQLSKFGAAFEFMQRGYDRLKQIGFEKSPRIVWYLQEIGQCYYLFSNYEGAIPFLREALQWTSPHDLQRQHHATKNTIALCFQKLEQYDSARYYFQLAHEESLMHGDTFWAALANGNIGYLYYLAGEYDQAIPLMEADFQTSDSLGEHVSALNAAMSLSTMFLKKGDHAKAEFYLDYSRKYLDKNSFRNLAAYYNNMAVQSRFVKDYERAFIYADSAKLYEDSLRKVNDANIINQSRRKIEVENHVAEIRLLEATRSRQVILRNALLIIIGLVAIIAIQSYYRQRFRRRKEQELATLEQANAEAELNNARQALHQFTNALKEKNELIESFRTELDLLHQSTADLQQERTDQLTMLLNATILTEEDWKEFRLLFEKVHPGFFTRLREKMTDLSPADTRLLALTKLQLAPKEMAAMLGISYEAIKKSRQRLRRKINLPEEGSLDELVALI
jgi:tetratricopeptide (TPR) repeat protein